MIPGAEWVATFAIFRFLSSDPNRLTWFFLQESVNRTPKEAWFALNLGLVSQPLSPRCLWKSSPPRSEAERAPGRPRPSPSARRRALKTAKVSQNAGLASQKVITTCQK